MESNVKLLGTQNNESASQNNFGKIAASVKPLEMQSQTQTGADKRTSSFSEVEESTEVFSADGSGQAVELQVDADPMTEPTFLVAEQEKGVGFDGVDESSVGQVKTTSIEFIQEVISQVKPRIKNGETSMRLKVNPKDLGAIEIQMVSNERGVTLSFVTEQASTGQLLESQSSQLKQSLKEAGVQLTNLNISQQNHPGKEGGFFRQDRQFVQSPRRSAQQIETVKEERMRPRRITGSSHEIDYLV
jgi:flagellar hook-length control protein FliK